MLRQSRPQLKERSGRVVHFDVHDGLLEQLLAGRYLSRLSRGSRHFDVDDGLLKQLLAG
jgi:hypothetical protein